MENVAYIESHDINDDVSLKRHVGKGRPVIIMGTASFCGHCTDAKPAFEEFAASTRDVVAATIVSDGESPQKIAALNFTKWDPGYLGVPAYFGFSSNGKFKAVHDSGRTFADLLTFANTLS